MRKGVLLSIAMVAAACAVDKPAGDAEVAQGATYPGQATAPQLPQDTLDRLIAGLEPKLVPLMHALDSARQRLAADSGTLRADSAFMAFRDAFAARVGTVAKTFDDSAFQAMIWPEGYRAQQLRRSQGQPQLTANPDDQVMADSVMRYLDARGIWSKWAEGDTYFEASETALARTLGPLLSPSTREFLRLRVQEQTRPTGGDAAVAIPWDSLAERQAASDRFLAAYPDAPATTLVGELRIFYLRAYLTGWDNTDIFDHNSRQLRAPVRQSFERYVAQHGSTVSGEVVRRYLSILQAANYRHTPEVTAFIRDESGIPRR